MSWLGGGLSSLTDQITNFTKEVLIEGREEVSDHVTELNIASRRIQELEVQCTAYRQEIERIRRRNSELEERCQATELQVTSVSAEYRSLLKQKEDELQQALKQKHHDLLETATDAPTSPTSGSTLFRFHGDDEADLGDLITSQLEINRLATEVRKLRVERDHWRSGAVPEQVDDQNGKETSVLLTRIKELEKSVQEATDLNHHQVVALQDHYEQRLAEVQQGQQARIASLQKQLQLYQQGLSEDVTEEGKVQSLQRDVEETQKKLGEEKKKLDHLRKEHREKEKTVQLLNRQIDKLHTERLQLNKEVKLSMTNLEDLQQQTQHGETNEKATNADTKQQCLPAPSCDGVQSTTTQAIQDIHDTRTKLFTGATSIQNQLLQERQTIVDQLLETEKQKTELKCWLGMLENEKSRLSGEIKALIHSLGKDDLLGYINALEEENTVLKSQTKETEMQLPESDRMSSLRPEPLGESSSDALNHSSCLLPAVAVSPTTEGEDDVGAISEMADRNKELCGKVRVLQLQVEAGKKDMEHLQWLLEKKNKSEYEGKFSDDNAGNNQQYLHNFHEQISKLEKENAQTLEEKDSQIHELMEEKLSLEISLEELDAQNQEAMEKILLVKEDLMKTNKEMAKKLTSLQETLHQQEEQIIFLKTENETLQEQFLSLAKKPQQEAVQSTSSSEASKDERPYKSILEAVNSINADNLELEEKMSVLEVQRKELETKLMKAETLLQEEKVTKELTEKESQSLISQLESLKSMLSEITASQEVEKAGREAAEEECCSLRAQLKEMEGIVLEKGGREQLQDPDAELIARVQELTSEKENLQNEADDLWARMIATSQETENLNLEIANLHLANRKLQEEMENVQIRCQQEIQSMEDKVEELEKAKAKQQDEGQQSQELLQREIAKLQKDFDDTLVQQQQEGKVLEDKCGELEKLLTKGREDSKAKQESLEKEIARLIAFQDDSSEDVCESDQKSEQMGQSVRNAAEYLAQIDILEKQLDAIKKEKCSSTVTSKKEVEIQVTDNSIDLSLKEKDAMLVQLQNELKASKLELEDLYSEVEHFKLILKDSEKDISQPDEDSTFLGKQNKNDLMEMLKRKDAEILTLNNKIESLLSTVKSSTDTGENSMANKLRMLEIEKEQMLAVMNDKSRECSSLKAEVHRLMSVVSAEKQALSKLQQDNKELVKQNSPDQEMTKEAVQKLSRLVKDRDIEMEALQQKNQTLLQFIQQSSTGSECMETLLQEKEALSKQVLTYQSEREQIITVLQQKHQESLQYHGEVQRLNGILSTESQKYELLQQNYQSVSQSFEEKQKTLVNTQNELSAVKARVVELERQQSDLKQKYVQLLEKDPEIVQVQRTEYDSQVANLERLSSKVQDCETLILEKDRLIYDLNREVREVKEETARKEESLVSLQNRLDNSGFQLNEAQRQVEEAGCGSENLRKDLERLQEECSMLKETNRSLSMMVKQVEFEKGAMQEKVETMTQILQQQSSESADTQKILENREALEKQAQHLHQERDQTMLALSQKQAENADLQSELHKMQEHNEKLNKELDRLRHHLIEVQENYTQEALLAEDREKNLRNRLAHAEERASNTSAVIMNASQQASIQVESLQKQVSKLAQEREQALQQISHLEDRIQEQAAGTTNLQLALEQIQRDQKRELQEMKKHHQQLLDQEYGKKQELQHRLVEMQSQLNETSEALDAASRLSEQLDRKEELIAALKEEVFAREQNLNKVMEEMREVCSHSEGKVDKQVMKSLVLGYFGSAVSQKSEVVRLLARVLDFSQDEMNKVGLKFGKDASEEKPGGWLSWIVRSPQTSKPKPTTVHLPQTAEDKSFTAQFVQFLQDESQPRPQIRLPLEAMTKRPSGSIRIPTAVRPNVIPSTNPAAKDFANHPLLKPISTTLPTFAPLPVEGPSKSNSSNSFLQDVLK